MNCRTVDQMYFLQLIAVSIFFILRLRSIPYRQIAIAVREIHFPLDRKRNVVLMQIDHTPHNVERMIFHAARSRPRVISFRQNNRKIKVSQPRTTRCNVDLCFLKCVWRICATTDVYCSSRLRESTPRRERRVSAGDCQLF